MSTNIVDIESRQMWCSWKSVNVAGYSIEFVPSADPIRGRYKLKIWGREGQVFHEGWIDECPLWVWTTIQIWNKTALEHGGG